MLTYSTLAEAKAVKRSQDFTNTDEERLWLEYLSRATRYIDRKTRRRFFPYVNTERYTLPTDFSRYRLRTFADADLWLEHDLLEVLTLTNGNGTVMTEGTHYNLVDFNIYPKYAIRPVWPQVWQENTSVSALYDPTITVNAIWGYHDRYSDAWINTLATVSGSLTANATSVVVSAAVGTDAVGQARFSVGQMLRIDNEFLEVTAVSSSTNTLTVVRGVNGSTAAAHDNGDIIKRFDVVGDIRQACFQIAKQWREWDMSSGGRIGVGEQGAGVELNIPGDAAEIVKSYTRSVL